jgi:hypothetical protein
MKLVRLTRPLSGLAFFGLASVVGCGLQDGSPSDAAPVAEAASPLTATYDPSALPPTSVRKLGSGLSYALSGPVRQNLVENVFYAGWNYDWDDDRPAGDSSAGFVPMIWGANAGATHNQCGTVECEVDNLTSSPEWATAQYLLGFNEPDNPRQSNLTYQDAATTYWSQLEALNIPLGSPAIAASLQNHPNWLDNFLAQDIQTIGPDGNPNGKTHKPRVDFIAVHRYAGSWEQGLEDDINAISSYYHKPVWLTEFAVTGGTCDTSVSDFMNSAQQFLTGASSVRGFAWFPFTATGDGTLKDQSALLTSDDPPTATALGTQYGSYADDAGPYTYPSYVADGTFDTTTSIPAAPLTANMDPIGWFGWNVGISSHAARLIGGNAGLRQQVKLLPGRTFSVQFTATGGSGGAVVQIRDPATNVVTDCARMIPDSSSSQPYAFLCTLPAFGASTAVDMNYTLEFVKPVGTTGLTVDNVVIDYVDWQ